MLLLAVIFLNGLTAACAAIAAYWWWSVATEKVPQHRASDFGQADLDWLTVPLTRQARFNARAALFAMLAAMLQVLAWVLVVGEEVSLSTS